MVLPILGRARLERGQSRLKELRSSLLQVAEMVAACIAVSSSQERRRTRPTPVCVVTRWYWFIGARLLWKGHGFLRWLQRQPKDLRREVAQRIASGRDLMAIMMRLLLVQAVGFSFWKRLRWFLLWTYVVGPAILGFLFALESMGAAIAVLLRCTARTLRVAVSMVGWIEVRGLVWAAVLLGLVLTWTGAILQHIGR